MQTPNIKTCFDLPRADHHHHLGATSASPWDITRLWSVYMAELDVSRSEGQTRASEAPRLREFAQRDNHSISPGPIVSSLAHVEEGCFPHVGLRLDGCMA